MVCFTDSEMTSDKNGRVSHYVRKIPKTVTIQDYFDYIWNGVLPEYHEPEEEAYCNQTWYTKTNCLIGKVLFEATITEPQPNEFG